MLETVREYAWLRLVERGEANEMRLLHAEYFLSLAKALKSQVTGKDFASWQARLEQDHNNLRAALTYAVETGQALLALSLCSSFHRFWEVHGYQREGRDWLQRAHSLPEAGDADPQFLAVRATSLRAAARLNLIHNDDDAAYRLYEESLAITRKLVDKAGTASALVGLGNISWLHGEYERGYAFFEEGLSIRREIQDRRGVAHALWAIGIVQRERGSYEQARAQLNESLAIGRELDDVYVICGSLRDLADTLTCIGQVVQAAKLFEEALALVRQLGDKAGTVLILAGYGYALLVQGLYVRARARFLEGLGIAWEAGNRSLVPDCLEGLAESNVEIESRQREGSKEERLE